MAKKKTSRKPRPNPYAEVDYVDLVELVRKSRSKDKQNQAFEEIERRMSTKIKKISAKFYIPGDNRQDIYQESLYALRYKAIKDYDKERGNDTGPYPFDKFAVLCIRRHLSTKLKSSYQNKKKALNQSMSLDQDRNDSSDDSLFLSDIIPTTDRNVLEEIASDEYFKELVRKLYEKLSDFEQQVFVLYAQKYSYEEITLIINKNSKIKINVKSVDNALSRIKIKAISIVELYDKKNKHV